MQTKTVKLACARVGHKYDPKGRFIGEFSQAAGTIVEMPVDEAERYCDRGLAEEVAAPNAKK